MRRRYCQRCSTSQLLGIDEQPRPCSMCGGTNFAADPTRFVLPKLRPYRLTDADRIFLRVQGIKPEDESDHDDGA